MNFKYKKHILIIIILLSYQIHGQVLGPEMNTGKFEFGFSLKRFHRIVEPGFPKERSWAYPAFFIKYGLNQRLTISAEGYLLNHDSKQYPNRDYRTYIIGAGVIFHILKIKNFRIALTSHYCEMLGFDRSEIEYHKSTQSIVMSIQFEQTFSSEGQYATFWFSPLYAYDMTIEYPWWSDITVKNKSSNNLGYAFGSNFLAFEHISLFYHIVYADFFQPRIGIGYQF